MKFFIFPLLALFTLIGPKAFAQELAANDESTLRLDTGDIERDVEKSQSKLQTQEIQQPDSGRVEKLQVTGSYVKRIDMEGPTPLVTWDRDQMEATGVNTVSDYLRESSLFEGSTDSGDRDGYFRFRGQHAGSTLVMINGLRLPQLGGPGRGFYTGVENIPTAIIERVEILKDGSSALYGSDAMAGVMNFITRKDYDGAEFTTRLTVPEAGFGFEQNHTLAFGKNYNKGSWFASVQYVEQKGYNEADIGNFHQQPTSPLSTSGNLTYRGDERQSVRIQQDCPQGDCVVDTRAIDYVRDPRENIGSLISGRIDINPEVTLSMVGLYNRRHRVDRGSPFRVNSNAPLALQQLGSQSLQNLAAPGTDTLEYSITPIDEVGLRDISVVQDTYSLQSQLVGYVGDTWRWDLSGSYAAANEERQHRNGLVDINGVNQLFNQGYDPTAFGQNVGAFSGVGVQGVEGYQSSQSMARFVASGDLFDFSSLYGTGGAASIAIGAEGQLESTNDNHDRILIDSGLNQVFGENQFGSRNVSSVFTEFVLYPLDQVELQLAGRYDRYSDFGDTANPKISLAYRPSKKVLLRTSWGTNFKAPSLRNTMERDRQTFERFAIATPTNPDGTSQQIPVTRFRDPNLGPELATNYNIGTVIQPNRQWTFTIDQWNFEGTNTIAAVSGDLYSDIARVIGVDGLADAGVTFETDTNGTITSARAPSVTNTGSKTIRGIDIGARFDNPIRLFGKVLKMSLSMDHTHMFYMNDRRTDNSPLIFREDLDWKNTMSATLRTQANSVRLAARTVAGSTTQSFRGVTRTHTEYDLNYNYNFSWSGTFTLGAKNLLNSKTPTNLAANYVDYNSSYSSYAFLPIGRRYYVGYSQSF